MAQRAVRHERLAEAIRIIRHLFTGDYVNFSGQHFQMERAKLYDLPDSPVPIGIAASGTESAELAADQGDSLIANQPDAALIEDFNQAGGTGKPKYGQLAICYDPDVQAARARAQRLWRWAAPGWPVMSELPDPRAFDAASSQVREEDIAGLVPCGPDPAVHVAAARQFAEAGFTHLALVQVGGEQQGQFIAWAEDELLPALRAAG